MKKPKTVEQILEIWSKQPGAVVSSAEREFITYMRLCASRGVGYGWMKQIIDWEWQATNPEVFPSPIPSAGSD